VNRILFNDGVSLFSEDWTKQFDGIDQQSTLLAKYLTEGVTDSGGTVIGFDVIPNAGDSEKFDIVLF
jgi:hypothetical protein